MSTPTTADIPLEQFDLRLLPASARTVGTEAFRDAVVAFFQSELKRYADRIQVLVDQKFIRVSWVPKGASFDPVEQGIDRLKEGDYVRGIQILRLIAKVRPNDPVINYNLGMALSDQGELNDAIDHLTRAVEAEPEGANVAVALGVALYRSGRLPEARTVLERAVSLDADNPYALRNLASCLLTLGDSPERPVEMLQRACALLPDDQQSWIGLGQALEAQKNLAEADKAFLRAIEINPYSQISEAAKTGRSRIAQANMREVVGGGLRPDAVMYCLGALQKCAKLAATEVQKIAIEIGTVGMKGINPNDSTRMYTLRSLPGEFTGLHLLCLMYVTWKIVAPQMDIGFDLNREYQEALRLRELESGRD